MIIYAHFPSLLSHILPTALSILADSFSLMHTQWWWWRRSVYAVRYFIVVATWAHRKFLHSNYILIHALVAFTISTHRVSISSTHNENSLGHSWSKKEKGKMSTMMLQIMTKKKMFITLPAQQWMNVVFIQAASKIHNYVGKLKLLSIFRLSSSSVFSFAFIVDCISSGLVFLVFIMDLFSHFHYLLQNSFHL